VQGVQIHHQDAVSCIASGEKLYLNLWNGPISVEALRAAAVAQRRLRVAHPQGYITLGVVGPRTPVMMSSEVRRALDEVAAEAKGYRPLCEAIVLEATGFVAAAGRAILSGMHAVSKVSYPRKVFDQVAAATDWVASQVGNTPTAAELLAVVEKYRPPGA
jgi:hypothetical protein